MFEKCLYFNINRLSRQINLLWEEAYRSVGLSPSHAYLLQIVLEHPGSSPKELAERMDLRLSTVTRFLDSLSIKGLVERRQENKDKRERSIYPTKLAIDLRDELKFITKTLHKRIRKVLGKNQVNEVVTHAKEFCTKINTVREKNHHATTK